jgi:hypothetical protein
VNVPARVALLCFEVLGGSFIGNASASACFSDDRDVLLGLL